MSTFKSLFVSNLAIVIHVLLNVNDLSQTFHLLSFVLFCSFPSMR
jgi:hypothetical protein